MFHVILMLSFPTLKVSHISSGLVGAGLAASQSKKLWIRYIVMSCFCPEWMFPGLTELHTSWLPNRQLLAACHGKALCRALPPHLVPLSSAPVHVCLPVVLDISATCCSSLTEQVCGLMARQDQRVYSLFSCAFSMQSYA